jgi:hypothetical protein
MNRLTILLYVLLELATGGGSLRAADPAVTTITMDCMSWYHPFLTPGVGDVTLLCTVVSVRRMPDRYGGPYWSVRLRIDESIFVTAQYGPRVAGAKYLQSFDFRRRKPGERIIFFGGIGEKYEGEDFLKPCWKGTSTDLGILLHPKGDIDEDENESLLESLRAQAKGAPLDADALEIFAGYCPAGVADYFIRQKRHQEDLDDEKLLETGKAAK